MVDGIKDIAWRCFLPLKESSCSALDHFRAVDKTKERKKEGGIKSDRQPAGTLSFAPDQIILSNVPDFTVYTARFKGQY